MRKFLIIILVLSLCGCASTNYQYYVGKGDRILEEQYSDSLIVRHVSDEICIYKDMEEGESGDYLNIHIQYYNGNRKLVAYKRITRFFNSLCYDGVLTEMTLYSIHDKNSKREKHCLHKENGNLLVDTLDCQFPYRFDYKLLYEWH